MNLGLLIIDSDTYLACGDAAFKLSRTLSFKGYDIKSTVIANPGLDVGETLDFIKKDKGGVIIFGKYEVIRAYFSENYSISDDVRVFESEDIIYAFMDCYDEKYVYDILIPALNSKCKTFYDTFVIKTFGKTEKQLRELLGEYIKVRNKITFRFFESKNECDIYIRYSSKTEKPLVDYIISGISRAVSLSAYAYTDVSLGERAAELLTQKNAKLCIAESFTGGGVAAALVQVPGISAVFKEGIVSYSNESKSRRLNVSKGILEKFGAVSIETAYEMAANSIMQSDCDYTIATTGNAGPTAERDGENGMCFIAVGNRSGIHIYKYFFEGGRSDVIESGIKAALYHLCKKLSEDLYDTTKIT